MLVAAFQVPPAFTQSVSVGDRKEAARYKRDAGASFTDWRHLLDCTLDAGHSALKPLRLKRSMSMSLSMYQASVPSFVQMLNNLSAILDKAEVYAKSRKIDPEVLLNYRLAPDMLPFIRQVQ